MYTNQITEHKEVTVQPNDPEKRIKFLEDRVRHLSEQVNKMANLLALNSRQIRRQNTDIHNVTTVIRNKNG
jgi:TolA-binding protein